MTLFVAGAAILGIGIVSYVEREESVANVGPELPSTAEMANMPAVPYDPPAPVAEPEPTPEPTPPVIAPLRMVIESIGVDAPVVEMGLDGGGVPQVPYNGQEVAWYNFSTKPGEGSNAVFAGHINWERAPGVFAELAEVQPGDLVSLFSDNGSQFTYEVTANFPVDPADPASLKVMAPTETDTITLITCGGTWIPDPSELFGGNYTNRTIVQAKLLRSSLAAPVPNAISAG